MIYAKFRVTLILCSFRYKLCAALLFLAIASPLSHSAPMIFQDHNFAIEIPATWQTLNPPSPQTLIAAQTPDGLKVVMVNSVMIAKSELSIAADDMARAARQSAIDKGWNISSEDRFSFGGVFFQSIAAEMSPTSSFVSYVGVAGKNGYVLVAIDKAGSSHTDEQLKAVIGSFRLLPILQPHQT